MTTPQFGFETTAKLGPTLGQLKGLCALLGDVSNQAATASGSLEQIGSRFGRQLRGLATALSGLRNIAGLAVVVSTFMWVDAGALQAAEGVARLKTQLRLASEGKLTVDVVVPALISQLGKLRDAAASVPDSIESSEQLMRIFSDTFAYAEPFYRLHRARKQPCNQVRCSFCEIKRQQHS